MAIEPIKGFYVHDEVTDTDGVAKYALSAIDGIDEIADWVQETTTTTVDASPWTSGYKAKDGSTSSSTSYIYSSIVSVMPGDTVEVYAITGSGSTQQPMRFQCAYNGETVVPDAGSNVETQVYTVPEGVDGVSVTCYATHYSNLFRVVITRTTEHAEVTGLSELDTRVDALEETAGLANKNAYVSKSADTLTTGGVILLENARCEIKKSTRAVFECDGIPTTLYIGFSKVASNPGLGDLDSCIKLDGTNLSYRYNTSVSFADVPHGLTLANNVQIIVEIGLPQRIHVTLISDGQMFQYAWNSQFPQSVTPCVIIDDGTVTNAKFTWTCYDFNKKVWLFGDSYMSMGDPARWVYYLSSEYDYNNYINHVLIDAYSGENSSAAFASVSKLLAHATPKYILWALGMNDGSDSSTAPSTNWATYRDQFITLCENNGVTPIFATIPTVPTVNNEKKNEWVRNSGYRFVDFAKAVGAYGTGAWFTGMLSSDNVHPSEQGALALFARVLLDLPEIMIEG